MMDWVKETPDRLINKGDPSAVTQCPECGTRYRLGMRYEKPAKSWLRIVLGNWWTYGWRITVDYGSTHPIGYGISWHEENRLAIVMHPIPFSDAMRLLREFACWLRNGAWRKFPTTQDRIDAAVARKMNALTRVVVLPTPEGYFEQQYGISPEEAWANKVMIGPVDMCNFVREYTALSRRERA